MFPDIAEKYNKILLWSLPPKELNLILTQEFNSAYLHDIYMVSYTTDF